MHKLKDDGLPAEVVPLRVMRTAPTVQEVERALLRAIVATLSSKARRRMSEALAEAAKCGTRKERDVAYHAIQSLWLVSDPNR